MSLFNRFIKFFKRGHNVISNLFSYNFHKSMVKITALAPTKLCKANQSRFFATKTVGPALVVVIFTWPSLFSSFSLLKVM